MSVSNGRKRRSVTLSEDRWQYLETRLNERINSRYMNKRRKNDTISGLIEELVLADEIFYGKNEMRKHL